MTEQTDLFGGPEQDPPGLPLAARLRPRTFDELVGQGKSVAVLRGLAESGNLPSLVLWGPPGSGKTTLARIVAAITHAHFASVSAVSSGVADLRKIVKEAQDRRRLGGGRTILLTPAWSLPRTRTHGGRYGCH